MAPVEGRCSSPYAQLADVCAWLLAYAMPAYLVLLIKLSPMFFSAIVKVPAAACQTQAADDMRNVRNI